MTTAVTNLISACVTDPIAACPVVDVQSQGLPWMPLLERAGLLGVHPPRNGTSNVDASDLPFQRWYRFKEAFTPSFVAEIFAGMGSFPATCLDPFGGSGTTALTAQRLGVYPTTIEVNPFLADLTDAKLFSHSLGSVRTGWLRVLMAVAEEPAASWPVTPPPSFIEPGVRGRWIFDREIAGRIGAYVQAISAIEDPHVRRLFRVLLGSALIHVSNVVISGKGRRYRGARTQVRPSVQELDARLDRGFRAMFSDIARYGRRPEPGYRLLRGDARVLIRESAPVDAILFSPPYPNSFDYTDIYNVELWALGYLSSSGENRSLREATLRSHVQIVRSFDGAMPTSPTLDEVCARLRELGSSLWSPHIPAMLRAYFADMCEVLSQSRERLKPGGAIFTVVGDSRYAKVKIDVSRILCELSAPLGLRICRTVPVRSMRSSAQQGGELDLTEWLLEFRPS